MNSLEKLWKCITCWRVEPSGDQEDVQAIISLSHGENANRALAKLVEPYRIPRILPREVAAEGVHPCYVERGSDTFSFLSAVAGICRGMEWQRVIVIAQPFHLWRSKMVAEKLGLEVVTIDVSSVVFDGFWHKWHFLAHELASRLVYWWRGWI